MKNMANHPDRRPTSLHKALLRMESLRQSLEGCQAHILDTEQAAEAANLYQWIDIEGELDGLRTVLLEAAERLVNIEEAAPFMAPVWLVLDRLDALADAAHAKDDLAHYLKVHEIASAAALKHSNKNPGVQAGAEAAYQVIPARGGAS